MRRADNRRGYPSGKRRKGKLLNLSAKEAVEYGLAESAASLQEVLKKEGLDGARIVPIPRTSTKKFINILTGSAASSLLVF